eukprot:TRINITY_DN11486_c0_g1_i1.p1 TRINITY_DN11486_c0_g1~~TRINITY_DN11486_c0_g1_i1.p1  ORF type:complete len:388 (+),score=52.07 TRINITY_DN11486_c0_g1_i1:52-1215(+)
MKRPLNTSCESAFLPQITKQEQQLLASDFVDLNRRTAGVGNHKFTFSLLSSNINKNRYSDVKPSDHSRVVLPLISDQPGSDYINASFIDDKNYISCQAPLPTTKSDFWRMIWETNCSLIVMLTNLTERNCVKADVYWPEFEGEILELAGLHIQLTKIQNFGGSTIRSFTIKNDNVLNHSTEMANETRMVVQIQYTQWPDQGTPTSTIEIGRILDYHDKIRNEPNSGPTVVHCSAGIGRSGSFIAADMLMRRMKLLMEDNSQKKKAVGSRDENRCFDEITPLLLPIRVLKGIVEKLREQRRGMVQTEEQYKFVYQIFKEKIGAQWARVCELQGSRDIDGSSEKNGSEDNNVLSNKSDWNLTETIVLGQGDTETKNSLPIGSPPLQVQG